MKEFKSKILIIVLVLATSILAVSFTLAKYTSTYQKNINLTVVKPQYKVIFNSNMVPRGYQQATYLENTGSQYVDTNFIPNQDTGVDVLFQANNVGNEQAIIYGAADEYLVNSYEFYDYEDNNNVSTWNINYGDSAPEIGSSPTATTDLLRVNRRKNVIDIFNASGNNVYHFEFEQKNFTAPNTMTVFAENRTASVNSQGSVKIYWMKIYDGDSLVRDYIPCYNLETGAAGLCDQSTITFYPNAGTDNFNLGSDVNPEKTQNFVYDTPDKLTANTFTRDGYTFNGWNTKPDGSGTSYTDGEEVNNLTSKEGDEIILYAQWSENSSSGGGGGEDPGTDPGTGGEDPQTTSDLEITYTVNGNSINVTLTNNSTETITDWSIEAYFTNGISVTNAWNVNYDDSTFATDGKVTFSAVPGQYNASIAPGASQSFGFNVSSVNDLENSMSFEVPPTPSTDPDPGTGGGEDPGTGGSNPASVDAPLGGGWQEGGMNKYYVNATVTNNSDSNITSWSFTVTLPEGAEISNYNNAIVTQDGNKFTFKNESYNGSLAPNGSTQFGFQLSSPTQLTSLTFE